MPYSYETIPIQNEHLRYIACFRDDRHNPFPGLGPFGSLPEGKSHVAGVLMTHIVQEAFGLRRWPGYADRLLSSDNEKAVLVVSRWFMTEPEATAIIQACAQELHRVRTQQLEIYRRRGQPYLTLYRNVGWLGSDRPNQERYAHLIHAVVMQARKTEDPAHIELDTVTHWTPDRQAYKHGRPYNIELKHDVPVDDILLDGRLVPGLEGPEVLVLNRSPNGLMKFSPDHVTFRDFQVDPRVKVDGWLPRLPLFIPAMERHDRWLTIHDYRADLGAVSTPELWRELRERLVRRVKTFVTSR